MSTAKEIVEAVFAAQFPDEKPDNYLAVKTGQRTVLNIFVNKKHVGGTVKPCQLAQLVKA
ncbi:hypothetical protein B0H17DRAFT_1040299 [Mycena rosella]|uniref:Uncharacterized protein n=1 Tax=Mycena rosella TaxID=1033263 RepID=A0AAD7GRY9_MYCRO|nr:hypothetical protein B0H17DRAFT_1040299 [Mycena rosella]